jgi:hypothetical protein
VFISTLDTEDLLGILKYTALNQAIRAKLFATVSVYGVGTNRAIEIARESNPLYTPKGQMASAGNHLASLTTVGQAYQSFDDATMIVLEDAALDRLAQMRVAATTITLNNDPDTQTTMDGSEEVQTPLGTGRTAVSVKTNDADLTSAAVQRHVFDYTNSSLYSDIPQQAILLKKLYSKFGYIRNLLIEKSRSGMRGLGGPEAAVAAATTSEAAAATVASTGFVASFARATAGFSKIGGGITLAGAWGFLILIAFVGTVGDIIGGWGFWKNIIKGTLVAVFGGLKEAGMEIGGSERRGAPAYKEYPPNATQAEMDRVDRWNENIGQIEANRPKDDWFSDITGMSFGTALFGALAVYFGIKFLPAIIKATGGAIKEVKKAEPGGEKRRGDPYRIGTKEKPLWKEWLQQEGEVEGASRSRERADQVMRFKMWKEEEGL